MKSRAPRRIASTARSTLPQAVITTTGKRRIGGANARQQVQTFAAGGCIASVVEIDQHDVEFVRVDGSEHTFGRGALSI